MAKKDEFVQKLTAKVSISMVANDSSFTAFTDAYQPQDLIGFVIQRVEYHFETALRKAMQIPNDRAKWGLSFLTVQPEGGFEADSPGVLDHNALQRIDWAALVADVAGTEKSPIVKDFYGFSGGGLLVHPVNLFAFGYPDVALANTTVINASIWFTYIDLTPDLHKELWQSIYVRQA